MTAWNCDDHEPSLTHGHHDMLQAAEQGGAGKEAAHDHADDGDAVKAADDDEEEDEDELVGPQLAASQAPVGSEDEGLHAVS